MPKRQLFHYCWLTFENSHTERKCDYDYDFLFVRQCFEQAVGLLLMRNSIQLNLYPVQNLLPRHRT